MSLSVATVAAKTSEKSSSKTTVVSNSKSNEKNTIVTTLFLADIDCPTCEKTIMNKIPSEKGVKDVKVDIKSKTVTVTYDSSKNSDAKLIKSFSRIKIDAKVAPTKR